MAEILSPIRNAVRAVIIRDNRILMLRKLGGGKPERYALPGGGQDIGETLEQALQRECLEEISTPVGITRLLAIADFFKHRDTVPVTIKQHVEFLFECSVPSDYIPRSGEHPDKHQVEVVWLDLAKLKQHILYPESLSDHLQNIIDNDRLSYLGTMN
jgi:8-oxo-dGTP diphosphatase